MLKEIRFQFRHKGCWLQETTERYPSVTLVISSVYQVDEDIHIDLFVHAPSRTLIDGALQSWSRDKRIHKISKLYEGPRGVRFHVSYSAKQSIYPHIIHHTPISLGAISMANGTEYYSILGEADDVQQLLAVLGKEGTVEVQSIKNLQEVPETPHTDFAGALTSGLTDKQMEALLFAHSQGYYNWPRVLSASDLATMLGLSSAAYLDHLRRAESKSVNAVVQNLQALDPARFEAVKARISATRARVPARAKKTATAD
ncbi:MAG: helix-turn-helix domain-containing protein [Euryarchaeota archaeon]|nr:helix-turn-helix domain-containing protein [Euryarchaeota archaeon]